MKPFPWKCGQCCERAVKPATLPVYETELEHDGRTYPIKLTDFKVMQCDRCGTVILDDEANRTLSAELRSLAQLLSPEEIRQKRLALDLTQKDLANYLRISEFTISRWESGTQIQQRCLDVLLRGFFEVEEFRRVLGFLEPVPLEAPDHFLPQQPIKG